MKKIKSILVPVDFSKNSIEALKFAAVIARKNLSGIILLNIVQNPKLIFITPYYGTPSPYITGSQRKLISDIKNNNARRLSGFEDLPYMKNIPLSSKVIFGSSVYSEIVLQAEESGADLIVMGSKGTTSLKKIFLGTNAERVIRLTSKPVIAFRGTHPPKRISKIVFASGFTKEAYIAYPAIKAIINNFNAEVHLLNINSGKPGKSNSDIMNEISRFSKRFPGRYISAVRDSSEVDEGIAKYAGSVKAGMIVMGVYRKKGPSRLLGNRILEGILRLTTIPVLAVDIH